MKHYGTIGTSQQTVVQDNINYSPAADEVLMTGERPSAEHIAQADGTWVLVQPTEEEQNKAAAATKKAELQNEASMMMLSVLAGGSLTEAQTAYTAKINEVPDNVAGYIPEVFPVWSAAGVQYEVGQRVQYNGVLYKVLTAHPSQESWKPDVSPSLFVKVISSISGEIPEWEQPTAENAYMKGDKVRYNGKVYESLIDNNVWKPDEYPAGWKEITETITIL